MIRRLAPFICLLALTGCSEPAVALFVLIFALAWLGRAIAVLIVLAIGLYVASLAWRSTRRWRNVSIVAIVTGLTIVCDIPGLLVFYRKCADESGLHLSTRATLVGPFYVHSTVRGVTGLAFPIWRERASVGDRGTRKNVATYTRFKREGGFLSIDALVFKPSCPAGAELLDIGEALRRDFKSAVGAKADFEVQ